MKVTALTTSKSLLELLTTADKALVQAGCGSCAPDGKYLVFLQVVGATDVYLELFKDATLTEGVKITALTGEYSLSTNDLGKIRLIADTASSDVKVLITT